MIDELFPNLFKIVVPLPQNPLKEINCYVVKGERNLIIDTGMNRPECSSVLDEGLKELGVDLTKTDFFITHMHADHSGLVGNLKTESSAVYCTRQDADIINADDSAWEIMRYFVKMGGFPEGEFDNAIKKHPGFKYRVRDYIDFTELAEGDIIRVGDYCFSCVETPGHTRGHICLYEADKKIFVSGDHILGDITPNISLWLDDEDPLADYIKSLDKVYKLEIEVVLPGHRTIFKNCRERIDELKNHHQMRADEVLSILEQGGQNAYQVASQMTWDMSYDSFEQFPIAQKWFASGEALAHLKYLEVKNKIKREIVSENIIFSLQQGGE
ncbi:MAG: MBL fold metallo-hydrolase [Dethiobacter sp.]|jgi:glyoxylase-like metal-dependent hydrolase (beta-lactamase superfamily II)|nr:MBL fold metallo-hydrolase [Dethiobacter sp.]